MTRGYNCLERVFISFLEPYNCLQTNELYKTEIGTLNHTIVCKLFVPYRYSWYHLILRRNSYYKKYIYVRFKEKGYQWNVENRNVYDYNEVSRIKTNFGIRHLIKSKVKVGDRSQGRPEVSLFNSYYIEV